MTVATRTLRTPAVLSSLDDVHGLLLDLWNSAEQVSSTDKVRFEAAVVEVAGNIIKHAVPTEGTTLVTFSLALTISDTGGTTLRAEFCDDSRPAVVDVERATMPAEDAEDGRGLALAVAASDVLRYRRIESHNWWTVECHHPVPPHN